MQLKLYSNLWNIILNKITLQALLKIRITSRNFLRVVMKEVNVIHGNDVDIYKNISMKLRFERLFPQLHHISSYHVKYGSMITFMNVRSIKIRNEPPDENVCKEWLESLRLENLGIIHNNLSKRIPSIDYIDFSKLRYLTSLELANVKREKDIIIPSSVSTLLLGKFYVYDSNFVKIILSGNRLKLLDISKASNVYVSGTGHVSKLIVNTKVNKKIVGENILSTVHRLTCLNMYNNYNRDLEYLVNVKVLHIFNVHCK